MVSAVRNAAPAATRADHPHRATCASRTTRIFLTHSSWRVATVTHVTHASNPLAVSLRSRTVAKPRIATALRASAIALSFEPVITANQAFKTYRARLLRRMAS